MNHLDEGRLLALRDAGAGELLGTEAAHAESCATCADALAALRTRAGTVTSALAALDTQWNVEAARDAVRARVTAASAARAEAHPLKVGTTAPKVRQGFWGLSRAAGLLLVTAAGVAALPGSPVRAWIERAIAPATTEQAVASPDAVESSEAPAAALAASETTGVRLAVPTGGLRVVVYGETPGMDVRVVWVPGTEAAVFAPAGSRFTTAQGRVEARVTPGGVRVELPRDIRPLTIEVGGRVYLRNASAGLDVSGPVVERSEREILFRIPGGL